MAVAALAPALGAQDVDSARTLMRSGQYAEAAAVFGKVAATDSAWAEARRGLVESLAAMGRYDDAERTARRAAETPGRGRELWGSLGTVLAARGDRAGAEAAFARAVAEGASDSLPARLGLAVLHWESGDRARALRELDHFIDVYNRGRPLTAAELTAVGVACRYLGARDPQLYKDAVKALERAASTDPDDPAPKLWLGSLLLEKYNGSEAQAAFDEVLHENPRDVRALVGAARRRIFDGESGADSLVARALAVNPNDADALVLRARLAVDLEDWAAAERDAGRALEVNASSSDALAVLAAARWLRGDSAGFAEARTRALALDPRDADFHATLADLVARMRLYARAADFARQAIALDSTSWRAHALLGMNLLRLGRMAEGRRSLETAFRGDPYDVWVKNTLDLLDTAPNYVETRTADGRFLFVVEKSESDLLTPYLTDLAGRAYQRFRVAYGYEPPLPVRIEVYRSHADFSVRTVGLVGLGALGVSFGSTLAFDSPAAKDAGPFNWGSTIWHELAHTFTLGSTEHRVPRWLSEGLSVYEEHRARPGWGFDVSPDFLLAFARGRLAPPSRMNDGFMRPTYPGQIQHSYYEASLVCDLIARDWGDGALTKLLAGYRAGLSTEAVFRQVLGVDLRDLDRRFDAYVRQRFAGPLAALRSADGGARPTQAGEPAASADDLARLAAARPDDIALQLAAGKALLEARRYDEARPLLERAARLFPEFGGGDGPWALLARLHQERGETRAAADALGRQVALDETDYPAHLALAGLLQRLGDRAAAADALDRAIYIDPFQLPVHQQLAELSAALGDHATEIRERRAVVALTPVDRADALYRLARAQFGAGDLAAARTSILRALEDAPEFAEAQDLLLAIVDARGRKP